MMKECNELPEAYEGLSVKDIPELVSKLELVSRDYKKWVTEFKCKGCGQLWVEEYVSCGHGEVPRTYKKQAS